MAFDPFVYMKKVILAFAISALSISAALADDLHFRLSPNPASSHINIRFDESLTGDFIVEVYTVLGTRVIDQTFHYPEGTNSIYMNTSSLAEGIYLVRVTRGNESTVKRLKIQRE